MNAGLPAVAVIGCGYWGKNIVRNFAELDCLSAISDPLPANSGPLSERFKVPVLGIEAILEDDGIAGVAIAAPAPLHARIAEQCLRAGKHVMVEKPIALSIDDARGMIGLAESKQRLLMVGHLLNYHSGFLKVVELVNQGVTGPLKRIYSNRLSFGKVRTEENVLWSFAPHDLSMILRLAGGRSPKTVSALGSAHVSAGIVDFCHVHMEFDDTLTAHTFVSWLHPFKEQKLVVIGEDAMIVFDDTLPSDQKVAVYSHRYGIDDGVPTLDKAIAKFEVIDANEPLRAECLAFLKGMSDPSTIYTDGQEGLRVLDVLSRAEASMAVSH
jgi:predicted dehydrogenase